MPACPFVSCDYILGGQNDDFKANNQQLQDQGWGCR